MKAEKKEIKLVWSFMHEDENSLCPFLERKGEVSRLSFLCKTRILPDPKIYHLAKSFQQQARLSSKDAVHLACADQAQCEYFLTCDDELGKRAQRLSLKMKVMNPVDYIREVVRQ